MVTTKDIAEHLGINRSSVSRALQGKIVSQETIDKVRRAAEELGYRPNLGARIMVSGRTGMYGLLLPNLHNPYFSLVAQKMQLKAMEKDHYLSLATYNNDTDECKKYIDLMIKDRRVDGLIIFSIQDPRLRETITSAADDEDIPIVLMDHSYHERIHCVEVDLGHGRYQVTRHLLDLGHTRIGLMLDFAGITPDQFWSGSVINQSGFGQAFHERGLEWDPELYVGCESTLEAGHEAARRLLARTPRPTAIVAGNDMLAVGVLAAAQELGLSVPRDLSLAGFDNTSYSNIFDLTTVDNLSEEFIETPINIINRVLCKGFDATGKITCMITPKLIIRGSTQPPRQASLDQ